ncbi:MAG: hypothetical protein WBE05_20865, partial [Pseudolabrys sp.]
RNALCAHWADRRCRNGRDDEDGVLTTRHLVPQPDGSIPADHISPRRHHPGGLVGHRDKPAEMLSALLDAPA